MYLTEKEIFDQYSALERTYEYFMGKSKEIREFWDSHKFKSITYIGCGSGYCLCKSGEVSAKMHLDISANAIAAGDLMLNLSHYKKMLQDTLIIAPSRSGSTSEVIMALEKAKKELGTTSIAISAVEDSKLSKLADLSFDIPWVFDESVCQTKNVTNFYAANLILLAIIKQDNTLLEEIKKAIESGNDYMNKYADSMREISANYEWEKVVVLADSELEGIASEGAIAFAEIPQTQSNYHHILDVRHGPAVLIKEKTLVIMACIPGETFYQTELVKDLRGRGALVVTISDQSENIWGSNWNVTVPSFKNYSVMGIPFIFVPQAIAYYKAIVKGVNPDVPQGLDAWIEL